MASDICDRRLCDGFLAEKITFYAFKLVIWFVEGISKWLPLFIDYLMLLTR